MSLSARIFRLSRAQFLPVILSPVLVGSALAWWTDGRFNFLTFALVLLGSIVAHLGANTIDDAYDYASGVDVVSNSMFPPDFGGWKVLPRGLMTFGQARTIAYVFFSVTMLIGLYLTVIAGPLVLVLGAVGIFFAYFHVAPPLRLGYRRNGFERDWDFPLVWDSAGNRKFLRSVWVSIRTLSCSGGPSWIPNCIRPHQPRPDLLRPVHQSGKKKLHGDRWSTVRNEDSTDPHNSCIRDCARCRHHQVHADNWTTRSRESAYLHQTDQAV